MKKQISIILIPLLLLTILLPFGHSFGNIAENGNAQLNMSRAEKKAMREEILATMTDLSQMYEKYDWAYSDEFVSSASGVMEIRNRLVVKAEDIADNYNAVDSTSGFGYAFLQYADELSAQNAYENFENLGYDVAYDAMLEPQAGTIGTDGSAFNTNDWAFTQTDVDAMLDYYRLKIKKKVVVAILDSGVNYNHSLVKSRIERTNFNGVTSSSDDEMDDYGHGTMLAAIVAKSTPTNVKIQGYKIADQNGAAYGSALEAALSYFYFSEERPDIVNISYYNCTSLSYINEMIDLLADDITFVLSAGNKSDYVDDVDYILNGRQLKEKKVISVGGIDNRLRNYYSDYGAFIDLSAPAYQIYIEDKYYSKVDGTSQAAAFVSAAAAVVLTDNPNYTPEEVKNALTDAVIPFKKNDCQNLHGAGIVNFSNLIDGSRAKSVTANYPEGIYREDINVELKCDNSLVDIYYTIDNSLPTKTNGIKYDSPVNLSESTRIIAAAYPKVGSTLHSKFLSLDYYILKNGESGYVIDSNGKIKQYFGNETDLTIPDEIDGIIPTAIETNCFRYKNVENIVLPDSIDTLEMNAFYQSPLKSIIANGLNEIGFECFEDTLLEKADFPNVGIVDSYAFKNTPITHANLPELWALGKGAFYNCTDLSSINIPKSQSIWENTFYNCVSLTSDLVLENVTKITAYGFANSYFKSITLPSCTSVGDYAFDSAAVKKMVLPNTASIGNHPFAKCSNLELLYIPKVRYIGDSDVEDLISLKILFDLSMYAAVPKVPSNAVIFTHSQLNYVYADEKYKYTIVAPGGNSTNQLAIENGHNFIPTESLNFNGISGEDCVYINTKTNESVTLPLDIVSTMWKTDFINSEYDSSVFNWEKYGFLLDFTNDGIINAKDYAELYKYNNPIE